MMKLLLFIIVTLSVVIFVSAFRIDPEVDQEWHRFKALYNRTYKSGNEEKRRREIFGENIRFIMDHNGDPRQSFKVAVNGFADLTVKEFQDRIRSGTGFVPVKMAEMEMEQVPMDDLPDQMDWVKYGMVTPVQNQGETGASWAYSAVAAMESENAIHTGTLVPLSVRQLAVCCPNTTTTMDQAFQYVITNGGIDKAGTFTGPPCDDRHGTIAARFRSIGHVKRGDEQSLKAAVANVGPVSVAIDASSQAFMFYRKGIFDHPDCRTDRLDHAVTVVGYGYTEYGAEYWMVKNSWGTDWGINGYIFMARNKNNQCGIATMASYPIVKP